MRAGSAEPAVNFPRDQVGGEETEDARQVPHAERDCHSRRDDKDTESQHREQGRFEWVRAYEYQLSHRRTPRLTWRPNGSALRRWGLESR
jgi:hypothetical protein